MDIECTNEELFIFKKIAEAADELSMPVYVIGGFVRDKIMHRITKDADIVCVGDGIKLAKKTAQNFHTQPQVNIFKTFGTAQIKLSLNNNEVFNTSHPSLKEKGWDETFFEIEFARLNSLELRIVMIWFPRMELLPQAFSCALAHQDAEVRASALRRVAGQPDLCSIAPGYLNDALQREGKSELSRKVLDALSRSR